MLTFAFPEEWKELLEEMIRSSQRPADIPHGKAKSLRLTLESYTARARQDWARAVFSSMGTAPLERYFTVHQRWLGQTLDRLEDARSLAKARANARGADLLETARTALGDLIMHLRDTYPEFFAPDLPAPMVIRQQINQSYQEPFMALSQRFATDDTGPARLVLDIARQLRDPSDRTRYAYRTLYYLAEVCTRLAALPMTGHDSATLETVMETLLDLNFNHLGFFSCCQQQLQGHCQDLPDAAQSEYLAAQQQKFRLYQERRQECYDPSWPSIYHMLYEWTSEELLRIRQKAVQPQPDETAATGKKVVLNLPAAQLACLIKLFYKGNWCRDTTLTELFKFTAAHFESRMMDQLSWRSLSKEYYSINQTTAARVKDLLQQMIAQLNRLYFPVWAAGYLLIYFY
jgi:hypothetical protein